MIVEPHPLDQYTLAPVPVPVELFDTVQKESLTDHAVIKELGEIKDFKRHRAQILTLKRFVLCILSSLPGDSAREGRSTAAGTSGVWIGELESSSHKAALVIEVVVDDVYTDMGEEYPDEAQQGSEDVEASHYVRGCDSHRVCDGCEE